MATILEPELELRTAAGGAGSPRQPQVVTLGDSYRLERRKYDDYRYPADSDDEAISKAFQFMELSRDRFHRFRFWLAGGTCIVRERDNVRIYPPKLRFWKPWRT